MKLVITGMRGALLPCSNSQPYTIILLVRGIQNYGSSDKSHREQSTVAYAADL